jgi:DNA-binding LacI/PurR family transcriptional regulator
MGRILPVGMVTARKATIFEVAEAAGVSITTVSHVFSGKRRVNAQTRTRVLESAERLAYSPSSAAQALATGRRFALALQVSFTGEALVLNSFFALLLPALSLAAVERGYSFLYVPPSEEGRSFIDPLVGERRIDGAVLVDPLLGDPFVEAIRQAGVPFVTIGRLLDGSSDVWVDNDHASVCADVAEHLRAAGYRHPALLTIETDVSYGADYVAGFRAVFPDGNRIVVAENFSPHAAMRAAATALASDDPPDAFFAVHDQLALGIEPAIEAAGLRVGHDVGIVAVGDGVIAQQAHVPMTSVNVATQRFGPAAVALLDELITGGTPTTPVVVPARLVARASTVRT